MEWNLIQLNRIPILSSAMSTKPEIEKKNKQTHEQHRCARAQINLPFRIRRRISFHPQKDREKNAQTLIK